MTHEDLTVIAGHPGGHAGHKSIWFHFAAIHTAIRLFPGSLFYQQIKLGIFGRFIGQTERDTAGKLTLGGIITKIQLRLNNRTAEFADTSTVLFGIMLTAIYQDGEAFETVFYGL